MTLPTDSWFRSFRRRMLGWFGRNAQDLPWRRTRDPYAVWLSEIMLQQTQVATVIDYFNRFIKTFPDVRRLAAAREERVLRLWEGLGYYRRARQLHETAKIVVRQYGGVFPTDLETLRRLPGIGRYTAGAILSIAFDRPAPILEANTLRVFSRLLGYSGDPHSAAGQKLLWSMAEAILPRKHSGQLNQALMELGREICRARKPRCETCPVFSLCQAFQEHSQEKIPRPKRKPAVESVNEVAVVIRRSGRVLLLKRGDSERWSGLWDFPRFPQPDVPEGEIQRAIAAEVRRMTGVRITLGSKLTTLRHGVTRFRITLDCYAARCLSATKTLSEIRAGAYRPGIFGPTRPGSDYSQQRLINWWSVEELPNIPLNRTGRQLAELIV